MGLFPCGEEQDDDSMNGPAQAGQQAGGSKGLIVRMCGKDDERGLGRHGLDPERGKLLHTGFPPTGFGRAGVTMVKTHCGRPSCEVPCRERLHRVDRGAD